MHSWRQEWAVRSKGGKLWVTIASSKTLLSSVRKDHFRIDGMLLQHLLEQFIDIFQKPTNENFVRWIFDRDFQPWGQGCSQVEVDCKISFSRLLYLSLQIFRILYQIFDFFHFPYLSLQVVYSSFIHFWFITLLLYLQIFILFPLLKFLILSRWSL